MERIKQALERARAERAGGPTPVTREATAAASKPAPPTVDNVIYSQTRHCEISASQLKENRVITGFTAESPFADAYKILRTQVLQRLKENDWNVLAVTSPGTGEGKTLTALNLAASLAMEVDYTVLLVDADLRHPGLHKQLGLPDGKGLSDYLLNDTPLSELLIHPAGIDHLTILPGGSPLTNSSEMLNSPRMSHLVDEMKNRYPRRIVIFDLPPVLNAADAMAFAPYVDATLLVIEEGKTKRKEAEHAVELLSSTNVLGTILNKAGKR